MSNEMASTTKPANTDDWCTVVVPCYNEFDRLSPQRFYNFLELPLKIRFLFVNDGSSDQTLSLLEEMRTHAPERIHILDNQPNRGKAESVRLGMLKAVDLDDAAYTGFWDADLATPLESIPKLMQLLLASPHLQMVFGSRVRLLGREIHRKAVRHYAGRVFATVASASLGLPIYDTQCGAKLFRITPDLSRVLASSFLSRWVFDVELIARFLALHQGDAQYPQQAIYEFPLDRWDDVDGSKVSTLDFFRSLAELIQINNTYSR